MLISPDVPMRSVRGFFRACRLIIGVPGLGGHWGIIGLIGLIRLIGSISHIRVMRTNRTNKNNKDEIIILACKALIYVKMLLFRLLSMFNIRLNISKYFVR